MAYLTFVRNVALELLIKSTNLFKGCFRAAVITVTRFGAYIAKYLNVSVEELMEEQEWQS